MPSISARATTTTVTGRRCSAWPATSTRLKATLPPRAQGDGAEAAGTTGLGSWSRVGLSTRSSAP
eukprot:7601385-Lingulodinium_polyedra.AAC.1